VIPDLPDLARMRRERFRKAEPPVIGLGRGADAVLEEGMVLSVQSWVAEEGVGGCLESATVIIEGGRASALTRYGRS